MKSFRIENHPRILDNIPSKNYVNVIMNNIEQFFGALKENKSVTAPECSNPYRDLKIESSNLVRKRGGCFFNYLQRFVTLLAHLVLKIFTLKLEPQNTFLKFKDSVPPQFIDRRFVDRLFVD
jgi:hypothetical protein